MFHQINTFEMAQKQFDLIAEILDLDRRVRDVLRWPMREYSFRASSRNQRGNAFSRNMHNANPFERDIEYLVFDVDEFIYFWSQYIPPRKGSWPVIFAKRQGVKETQTQEPFLTIWVSRKFELSNSPLKIRPPPRFHS